MWEYDMEPEGLLGAAERELRIEARALTEGRRDFRRARRTLTRTRARRVLTAMCERLRERIGALTEDAER